MRGRFQNRAGAVMDTRPVPYVLRWRPSTIAAGAHLSARVGSGGDFRQYASLLRYPDPRRIDLRLTLRDPAGEIHVRQFSQRSVVNVIALVDLSGSMSFAGSGTRMGVVADLCAVIAASAHKMGDRFGLIGCDAKVRDDVLVTPTRRRGLEGHIRQRLAGAMPSGGSAAGLIEGARRLPLQRSLVFLISDFLIPGKVLDSTLSALWRHDVVPVMLCERWDELHLPRWGILQLRDLESGRRRLVVLRPSIVDAWRRAREEHAENLRRVFNRYGRTPFRVFDYLDVDALTRYLIAR